ncbi:MAG TPA: cytochrome P450 [Mycobacteriales bacterium]|nr:cytochrome P450 [Mycobacteriales bacterium]
MKSAATMQELLSPYETYRSMRSDQPVFRDEQFHAWHVYRYPDVERVLTEHETFRSNLAERGYECGRGSGRRTPDPGQDTMLRADPPRHRQLRGLVTSGFTAQMVARMAPRIRAVADTALDRALHRGTFDVVADLAYPLPVIVISELLGVPAERRGDFKRWSDAVLAGGCAAPDPRAGGDMHGFLTDLMDERRREPGTDLISALLAAEVDGDRLGPTELLSFCGMMLVAGHETTTNLIGNAVLCLDAHPHLPERLRDDPALLPAVIEEVLRYLSPVQIVVRYAATDSTIGGQRVRAGELVFPVIGSANRDEAAFERPDRFDADRSPNRHLAFGYGIHSCLGASLARLQSRTALAAMLERLPGRWEVPDVALDPLALRFLFGVRRLPLRWNA